VSPDLNSHLIPAIDAREGQRPFAVRWTAPRLPYGRRSRPFHAAPDKPMREEKNLHCVMDGTPAAVQATLWTLPCCSSLDKVVHARGEKKNSSAAPSSSTFSDLAPLFSFITHRWFPSVPSLSSGRLALSLCLFLSRCSRGLRSIQREKDLCGPWLFRPALFSLDKEVASLFGCLAYRLLPD
jgi:hypothetical protein